MSWNARGLLHSSPATRRKKIGELAKLAKSADIVMVQETHASAADVMCECAALLRGFWWGASPCEVTRAGGVLTMIRRGVLGDGEVFR